MEIGPKSIEAMKQMAENQIDMHADKMNLAWLKSEDGKLKVTMAFDVAVSQVAQDSVDIDCSLSFVSERIKSKVGTTVSENQGHLDLNMPGIKVKAISGCRV